jgi:hypothetical protein
LQNDFQQSDAQDTRKVEKKQTASCSSLHLRASKIQWGLFRSAVQFFGFNDLPLFWYRDDGAFADAGILLMLTAVQLPTFISAAAISLLSPDAP